VDAATVLPRRVPRSPSLLPWRTGPHDSGTVCRIGQGRGFSFLSPPAPDPTCVVKTALRGSPAAPRAELRGCKPGVRSAHRTNLNPRRGGARPIKLVPHEFGFPGSGGLAAGGDDPAYDASMTWREIGLIGAGLNVIGALLLVVVISPGRKRYENMTGGALDHNPSMERYLKDQQWAGFLILIGTTLQLLAALFA
jgi:hypothetical protein